MIPVEQVATTDNLETGAIVPRESLSSEMEQIYATMSESLLPMVPFHLSRCAQLYSRIADARLSRSPGLSLARFKVLSTLDARGGLSGTVLAEYTGQRPQSLGGIATALENEGLLERRPGPGRQRLHFLTPAGTEALVSARQILATLLNEDLFGGIDPAYVQRLDADLAFLADRLDKLEATIPAAGNE